MEFVQRAIELATQHHAFIYRKEHVTLGGRVPFIVHPMQVMKMVYDWGAGTEDNLAAAILHDAIEDPDRCGRTLDPQRIEDMCGSYVLEYVKHLTNEEVPGLSRQEKAERKDAYLKTFATKPIQVLVIKLADRYCNVHDFINCGDIMYAAKYSAKAIALYEAFDARQDEIANEYGQGTVAKIRVAVRELRDIAGV